jgi:DNA replication and repair protein RecF
MQVFRLKTKQFRNLLDLDLEFSPQFNFFYGPNGSGKSSLLEAIHFLSLGRSFRSTVASRAIHYEADQFNLFSVVFGTSLVTIGLEKTRQGKTRIKIDQNINPLSELAKILPIQLLNPDSYALLNGGPKIRRQFIDWGVFHVEPLFFSNWQQFHQTLRQRNAALQRRALREEIKVWDFRLIELALEITRMREKHLQLLIPMITSSVAELANLEGLSVDFYQGWEKQNTLEKVLSHFFLRDLHLGYTQYGPHRADLLLKLHGNPVHEVLSRGEQKLLAYALQLAQGVLLKKETDKACIYLFDDLFAELDFIKQRHLVSLLTRLGSQVFITVIDESLIRQLNDLDGKLFQVKNGEVVEEIFNKNL